MPTGTSLVEIDAPGQAGTPRARATARGRWAHGVGAVLAGLLAAGIVVVHVDGSPAGAGEDDCPGQDDCPDEDDCPGWVDSHGNCHVDIEVPVDESGGATTTVPEGPGGTAPLDPNRCEWHSYPADEQAGWRAAFPDAPPNAIFGEYHCFRDNQPLLGPYVPEWIIDTPDPQISVSPEAVARRLMARLETTLLRPDPVTSPPAGTPAVVGIPTFFLVANWQGEQSVGDCVGNVCVRLTGTPSLTLDPGAPDAATIDCAGRGTLYDPDGPPAADQAAAPGACAHTYNERTGVAGRPHHWDARLVVTWEVSWSGAGQSGSFDPITMLSPIVDIPVTEVSTVVVEAG